MTDERVKSKRRILVVDDEPRILRFISAGLSVSGYEVIPAASGEEALQLFESEKPDIVLLDIFMPGMDGFEVLQRLRASSALPIIVFSARSSVAEKALSLGANDFIAKPFRPEELVKKISAVLDYRKSKGKNLS